MGNQNNINNGNNNINLNIYNLNINTEEKFQNLCNMCNYNKNNINNNCNSIIKLELNILYYDEALKSSLENNNNCSFFKANTKGTFYGCHYFELFQY